ncbi:Kelch repeat and BTB domain-containing protein 8 [Frankliniella fusca]|uniref:Kelch repeat and BTB domain-containing protein 8 n=1 Tax=Frankliniella fusca TaxID=407009 RepID=A0AAE1HAQ0_9NEOP|nr:Kelch repeat and BTB domain-containing protein 8 [Frankliniella fusca]
MNVHEDQVKEVEVYLEKNVSERTGENPSVAHGINRRSPLMAITGCDVTKCLPQDFMHDTLEGSLKLDVCFLLLDVITKKQMTLNVVNERIQVFAKHFGVNKPSIIEMQYLEKKRLRQTASEMLTLAYLLPFVLRKKVGCEMVSVCTEENLKCYLLRLQLMTSLMAEEFTHQDIEYVSKLTEKHHSLFYQLYKYATPKMHYEVHTHQIMLYGPPRHYWCFRFEGKHAYFKRLLRIYRCFKDPSGTFARSHQRKLCGLMLMSSKGDGGPFLKSSDSFGAPREKRMQSLLHYSGLLNIFVNIPRDAILSLYKVVFVNGVTYKKANAIVVSIDGSQPVFGEITEILVYDRKLAFMYKQLVTQHYNETLHAFKVDYCVGVDYGVVLASDLPHCHQLFIIKSIGAYYIIAPNRNFGPKMKLR